MIQSADYSAAGYALLAEAEKKKIPYVTGGMTLHGMDCQGLIEYLAMQCNMSKDQVNLAGSNAHWRMSCKWKGTVAECVRLFGSVPPAAWLFIHQEGYNSKYRDQQGDASHVGVFLGGTTAIHASYSLRKVAASTFKGKAIDGGWNHIGLSQWIDFGPRIEGIIAALQGGAAENQAEVKVHMALYDARVETENKKGCYIRATPGGNQIATVPYGGLVQVMEANGDQSRVFWENFTGWMPTKFLQRIGAPDAGQDLDAPSLTGTYGVWIPCANLEDARALKSLLDGAGVKSL